MTILQHEQESKQSGHQIGQSHLLGPTKDFMVHKPRSLPKIKGLFKRGVPTAQGFASYGSIQVQRDPGLALGSAPACRVLSGYLSKPPLRSLCLSREALKEAWRRKAEN